MAKTFTADLLVGADGIRSTVRQQCAPEVAPLYAGYSAWRALIAESAFPRRASRAVRIHVVRSAAGRAVPRLSGGRPRQHLRPGHRRYNVVWYRPADEKTKLQWLLTDENGVTHEISIPPPLIRTEAIAEMRADAERLLAPQFRQIVRLIEEPILQPIYDLESPHMAFGRVAVMGDAAFVARPHVAAGVSKAADDAAALVERSAPSRRRRRRSSASRRRGCPRTIASSNARAISVLFCRQRARRRSRRAPAATRPTSGDRGDGGAGFPAALERR